MTKPIRHRNQTDESISEPEADSNEVHFLSIYNLLEYYFFLEMYDFNFTTFVRQILFFSLHYISIKVLKVDSRYYVAALKVSGWVLLFIFFKRDTFFGPFISNHSCRATWSDSPAFF